MKVDWKTMDPHELREAHRGWLRVLLTSALGIVSLATSTWLVVSHITELKIQVRTNAEISVEHNERLKVLENLRIPGAASAATTAIQLSSINETLIEIERRLYNIEARGQQGLLLLYPKEKNHAGLNQNPQR